MKNLVKLLGIIAIVAVIGFSVVACDNETIPPTVTKVTVNPSTPNIVKGNDQQFTATVTGTGNPSQTVSWSIVETNKDPDTTIGTNGKLTVAANESLTSLTVRATSTVDNTKSGTATVTIYADQSTLPTVTSVTVNPSTATVAKGGTTTFNVKVAVTNNASQTVTWSIVQTNKNAGTTIDANGKLTVAANESVTSLTVRATSTVDNTKSGTASVTITGNSTEDTHGIDTDNWPQENNLNSFRAGMAYIKSDDGLAFAANPMGSGDGNNYHPGIFVLKEGTGGAFPIGTWITRYGQSITFTSTTITFDFGNFSIYEADYSMTADAFQFTNVNEIEYTPTPEDAAKLAAFNEATFRSTRPWIPSTSTVKAVKVRGDNWMYNIFDSPDMTFITNANVIGIWEEYDWISGDLSATYTPPSQPSDWGWGYIIQFVDDGTVKRQYSYDDNVSWQDDYGTWTANTDNDTYLADQFSEKTANGIISLPWRGGDAEGTVAPEFVIKNYQGKGQFLFMLHKESGDYPLWGVKPPIRVFKKSE